MDRFQGGRSTPDLDPGESIGDVGPIVEGMLADMGWTVGWRGAPRMDMKVNGSDGPIIINKGDPITITASVTGALCRSGDYFLVAFYRGMFWTYKLATKTWVPGQSATFQGRFTNMTDRKIYSSTVLPPGKIVFFLVVDTKQDGVPNFNDTWIDISFDKAIVEVLK